MGAKIMKDVQGDITDSGNSMKLDGFDNESLS